MRERLMISERMASAGTLAAGVAHEINNPLAIAMTNLEFVSEALARVIARRPASPVAGEPGRRSGTASMELGTLDEAVRDTREAAGAHARHRAGTLSSSPAPGRQDRAPSTFGA